jgi:hypothetical protein
MNAKNKGFIIDRAIWRHFVFNPDNTEFSNIQEDYLKQIVGFCSQKHLKIILLNTPICKAYYDSIPVKFINKFYSVVNELKQQAVLFDFHALDMEERNYGDADHLNSLGAKVFTMKLDSLLSGTTK